MFFIVKSYLFLKILNIFSLTFMRYTPIATSYTCICTLTVAITLLTIALQSEAKKLVVRVPIGEGLSNSKFARSTFFLNHGRLCRV
jgi:hypothetical protein